jgi:hypothetical protein
LFRRSKNQPEAREEIGIEKQNADQSRIGEMWLRNEK